MTHLTPDELTTALRALRVAPPERDFEARLSARLNAVAAELESTKRMPPSPVEEPAAHEAAKMGTVRWRRPRTRYVALALAALALPAAAWAARSMGWLELPSWHDEPASETGNRALPASPSQSTRSKPSPAVVAPAKGTPEEAPATLGQPAPASSPPPAASTGGRASATHANSGATKSPPSNATSQESRGPTPQSRPTMGQSASVDEGTGSAAPAAMAPADPSAPAAKEEPAAKLERVRVRSHTPRPPSGSAEGTQQAAPGLREAAESAARTHGDNDASGAQRARERQRREGAERRERRQSGRQNGAGRPR